MPLSLTLCWLVGWLAGCIHTEVYSLARSLRIGENDRTRRHIDEGPKQEGRGGGSERGRARQAATERRRRGWL